METAAELRRKADKAVNEGRFAEAADLYRKEAAIYRKNGDVNGAKVEETKADRYSSDIVLFAHLPGGETRAALSDNGSLAKWEPAYGCYLGGFIDRDERLGKAFTSETYQKHYDPRDFEKATGKKHASVFCYVAYGKPFPTRWVAWLRSIGVAPHIAFEPNDGLGVVQRDDYLYKFARAAASARCPIFLRFASEMNGDWTKYGGDPLTYKTKWGLVKQVMEEVAPNVAMVWCVNAIPEEPIQKFYPGDAYVDWVGVNFYAVPFHDNNRSRPGLAENPADNLKYVYSRFARTKPIMVCEFGASRESSLDNQDRSEWAALKIQQLYAALPRLYPRVKMVDIFDCDNLKYAMAGRQLNNYSVTDNETVRKGYASAIDPDYFLSDVVSADSSRLFNPTPIVKLPASGLTVPRGILRVSAWARSYTDRFTLLYTIGGNTVAKVSEPGPRFADINLDKPGPCRLLAVLKDEKGRVAAKKEFVLTVK